MTATTHAVQSSPKTGVVGRERREVAGRQVVGLSQKGTPTKNRRTAVVCSARGVKVHYHGHTIHGKDHSVVSPTKSGVLTVPRSI